MFSITSRYHHEAGISILWSNEGWLRESFPVDKARSASLSDTVIIPASPTARLPSTPLCLAIYTDTSHPAARRAIRDLHYFGRWSAFYNLVQVIDPGGTLGLDDKLFLIPGQTELIRFQQGQQVDNFRDLRADARCIVESGLMSLRMKMEDLLDTDGIQVGAIVVDLNRLASSGGIIYRRLISQIFPRPSTPAYRANNPVTDYTNPYHTPPMSSTATPLSSSFPTPPYSNVGTHMPNDKYEQDGQITLPFLSHAPLAVGLDKSAEAGDDEREWERRMYTGMMQEYRRLRATIV